MSQTSLLYKHLLCSSRSTHLLQLPYYILRTISPNTFSFVSLQPFFPLALTSTSNNKFVSDKFYSMSSRRSRSIQSGASRNFTEEQITDLIFKLQQLIPEICHRRSGKVSASKVLQETCSYIRSLRREVEDLSSKLSELLSSADVSHAQAAIIRSLFV